MRLSRIRTASFSAMAEMTADPAALQRADETASIRLLLEEGHRDYALRSLDERGGAQELVRQQYSGRYPFELLQNANDAARERGQRGRARFILTDTAVLIADNGSGFGEPQVRAICSLGRSSKGPGTSIGHKGLGFKSVGEITERPQIISTKTRFQFDSERLSRDLAQLFGRLPSRQRLPVYAFPYPIGEVDTEPDATEIALLQDEGFDTVVRLPLRHDVDRSTVAHHLVDNLHPRLLLFLPDTDHLELRGTGSDFSAEIARANDGPVEHVLLETKDLGEEWLIYRGSVSPDAAVLQPMGEAWAEVREVNFAVAVPLDDQAQPVLDESFPLHVYFPTEEVPGLHVAVHAEWALTMDRRRIAETPEASDFNALLLNGLTEFVTSTLAADLVSRCGATAESVQALIPIEGQIAGVTAMRLADQWRAALHHVPFLPFADQSLRQPNDAQLLPNTLQDHALAHELATLPAHETLRPDIEAVGAIRALAASAAGSRELSISEFLALMATPTPSSIRGFYTFLVNWRNRQGLSLVDELGAVQCVLTTNGQFLTPNQQTIFFPRQDASVPDDIPVPVAVLPDVPGIQGLLSDLGVKDFEWRDLIREYLVKILERPDADPEERERALNGLRAYQVVRRSGGEEVGALLGRVLLPTRSLGGERRALRRADHVYFGHEWTNNWWLEQIYGPFDEPEFLSVEIPDEPDAFRNDMDFYAMLGVVDHPRLHTSRDSYALNSSRHPHAGPEFSEWMSALGEAARRCRQGHTASQQLILSHQLDRLGEVASTGDPRRLIPLWNELAGHWGKVYEDGLEATIRCDHGWHSSDRNRTVESLFAYLLRTREWIPVELGGQPAVVAPGDAWVETAEPPPRIQERIPRISDAMRRARGASALISALGLIQAGRPEVTDLLRLLDSIASEADTLGGTNREIDLAARWVQRTIDDVLPSPPEPLSDPGSVRVLATHAGRTRFVSQPPYADDALLRDTWEQLRPILSADTGLTRLTAFLSLVNLDDAVTTTPIAFDQQGGLAYDSVRRKVDSAKPYIYALILAENSRAVSRVRPALRRLELVVCERLVLKYEFDGHEVERDDATCFIATRQELHGQRRYNIGTAYLELDESTHEPDWFAVGRQLAQYLEVMGHADAITMLLKMDQTDRDRLMADRRISNGAVAEAREQLDLPLEDELESASSLDALASSLAAPAQDSHEDESERLETSLESPSQVQSSADGGGSPVTAPAPPPISWESVELVDATPSDAQMPRSTQTRRRGSGIRTSRAPSIQTELAKTQIGKRGEEIAFHKERERVASFGLNPDVVVWRSETDELAPIDILSFDEGGDRIYIEVKATTGSDPTAPFDISRSELLEAAAHGARYYIYRVTDTNTSAPRITRWADPMRLIREHRGHLALSGAQMELGLALASQNGESDDDDRPGG